MTLGPEGLAERSRFTDEDGPGEDEDVRGADRVGKLVRYWLRSTAEVSDEFRTKHELADAVRGAIAAIAMLDPDAVEGDELAELVADANALRSRLESLPRFAGETPAVTEGSGGALLERSPVSGRSNPIAPPLPIDFDGERTRATLTYGKEHEGPPRGVHGGMIAAAFDEILGIAQMATGAAGVTGTLTIRYRRFTPIDEPITYEGTATGPDGRRITATARSMTADGTVLAEAEGVFITGHGASP